MCTMTLVRNYSSTECSSSASKCCFGLWYPPISIIPVATDPVFPPTQETCWEKIESKAMTQVLYILFADVISLVFLASYWAILAHFGLGIFSLLVYFYWTSPTKIDCNHSLVVWPNWKERWWWCNLDKWVAICRPEAILVQLGNIWLFRRRREAVEKLLKGKTSEKGQKRVENQDFEYTFPTNWHPNLELFFSCY